MSGYRGKRRTNYNGDRAKKKQDPQEQNKQMIEWLKDVPADQ